MTYLGWIGNVLIVIGLWKLGSKTRSGFLFQAVGEILWITKAVYFAQWDLAAVCCVFAALGMRSWFKWSVDDASVAEKIRRHLNSPPAIDPDKS